MRRSLKHIAVGILILIAVSLHLHVYAYKNNSQSPKVLSKSVTPTKVAYNGNETPAYLTVEVTTDKPTKGYIDVIGESETTTIELSNVKYRTVHKVDWSPWNPRQYRKLQSGEYTLKLNLTDESENQIVDMSLGKITVVDEPNPKEILEVLSVTPSEVVADPDMDNVVTLKYRLNRPARVIAEMQSTSGTDLNGESHADTDSGVYEISWNLKDQEGKLVSPGHYEFHLRVLDLTYNESEQNFYNYGIFVDFEVKERRLTFDELNSIISDIKFDKQIFTPNDDGIDDIISGSFTVNEKSKVSIYVKNAGGANVKDVMPYKEFIPGSYTFTWDGKDFYGSRQPNGSYYFDITVTNSEGLSGHIKMIEDKVRIEGSYSIEVPQPVKRVRVISDSMKIYIDPIMQKVFTVNNGDVFPVIGYSSNVAYNVLVAEGVIGEIPLPDAKLIEVENVPEKWGQVLKSGSKFFLDYRNTMDLARFDKILNKGSVLKIIHEFGNWYHVALDSGEQGFVLKPDVGISEIKKPFTIHIVSSGESLWKVSKKYGVEINDITRYNNLNVKEQLLIGQNLVIPVNSQGEPKEEHNIYHIVEPGDSLWKIAQQYNTTVQKIAELNNIDPNQYLSIDQKLIIKTNKDSTITGITHVVLPGDTLWEIAEKYNTTIEKIVNANNLKEEDYLFVGQKLIIPKTPITYIVKPGDSLWKIAQSHNTTVDSISILNEIDQNDDIYPGQQLIIK